ncbi:response regulator [Paracraurococcus lichenis]|uniref:Response regulator transcription factor n=1 Tax=Paracraurococcus lichenis TaxID=3064888 RepID=A0ABT9EDH8_9PROT|nr:response regulator transcription factor [Paracraurococcus sp. LOR1-02]MDO9714277.1 response regulator transcription factor [Paracraurococcus sp. LOR1-02]
MVRILLADDHDVVRHGLKHLLESESGWEVCGEAHDGREAVALAEQLKPDIAVLDITMPVLNGLEVTRRIRATCPETEVLVFTMHESEELMREVFAAGARGYLIKSDAARYIVAAVDALTRHQPFISSQVTGAVLGAFLREGEAKQADAGDASLTPREREVLQLLAEGHRNKEIARRLSLSVKTIEAHRAVILEKIGAETLADLVRYAVRNHIISG